MPAAKGAGVSFGGVGLAGHDGTASAQILCQFLASFTAIAIFLPLFINVLAFKTFWRGSTLDLILLANFCQYLCHGTFSVDSHKVGV